MGEERHRRRPLSTIKEHFENTPVNHPLQHPRALGVDDIIRRHLVREKWIVKPTDSTPIDEKRRITTQEKPAPHRLPGHRRQEREIRRARHVRGRDGSDVDFEVDGARR